MRVKKLYTYSNNRQLWKILPTDTGKLIIEERDLKGKQVFFNCINITSGKPVFKDYQFEEKYWVGIEAVTGDLVIFHRFVKPDLPVHLGMSIFDLMTRTFLWQTDEYNYLFLDDNKIYSYKSRFEGKEYFVLDLFTGELIESLGDNSDAVNIIKQRSSSEKYYENFRFPYAFGEFNDDPEASLIVSALQNSKTITGKIDCLRYRDLLFCNYHEPQKGGTFRNLFTAIDIQSKKTIFEETLNSSAAALMPDSFFMAGELLLLLKEKTKLIVCTVKQ